MVQISILTEGFSTPNGCAFLFPLIKHRNALSRFDVSLKIFTQRSEELINCDILILESKFYRDGWADNEDEILDEFAGFQSAGPKVYFFDTGDSSGWLQTQVLPFVDGYRKSQLLENRRDYLKPMYGFRPFTDYYHKKYVVKDCNPGFSRVVENESLLDKLDVSWNSGLADYSLYGPRFMSLYKLVPFSKILHFPKPYTNINQSRPNEISCRFGVTYSRETVSWQRKKIRQKFANQVRTNKLSRQKYFQELSSSRVIISPFGLGEITLKDFEVFLTGGVLLKPDMDHMTTWPNFFQRDKTMCTFDWDAENIKDVVHELLSDQNKLNTVGAAAQSMYRHYTSGPSAAEEFCQHFKKTVGL